VAAGALLDCLPIVEHRERTDEAFATRWWHWLYFAQLDKHEHAINADPDRWYHGEPERMATRCRSGATGPVI
jgi:haloacetate dehalogenase